MKHAPNEEAKMTARQIRSELFKALEAAIDNDWLLVERLCTDTVPLARHCHRIEASYREEELE